MNLARLLIGKEYKNPAFIAGHIYTFRSSESVDIGEIPKAADLEDPRSARMYVRTQPYYDTEPVCIPILHENHGQFELVINLKVLPPDVLRRLLIPLASRGENESREKLTLKTTDKQLAILSLQVAENLAGISLAPYLNKYYRKNIVSPKHIGWDEVNKILMIDWSYDSNIKTNTLTHGRIS